MRKATISGWLSFDNQSFLSYAECKAHEEALPRAYSNEAYGELTNYTQAKIVYLATSTARSAFIAGFSGTSAITIDAGTGWFVLIGTATVEGVTTYTFSKVISEVAKAFTENVPIISAIVNPPEEGA